MNRINDVALLVGRLCMAALFLPAGWGKLATFAGFAKGLGGLPFMPELWAAAAVAVEVLGSLLLVAGLFTRWAAAALIAFTLMATATAHRYWDYSDPQQRRAQNIHFYKNVAIAGGLLFLFVSGAGGIGMDSRRRGTPGGNR
jgi:putative oxidoreductase